MRNFWFATRNNIDACRVHGPFYKAEALTAQNVVIQEGADAVSVIYRADDHLTAFCIGELKS